MKNNEYSKEKLVMLNTNMYPYFGHSKSFASKTSLGIHWQPLPMMIGKIGYSWNIPNIESKHRRSVSFISFISSIVFVHIFGISAIRMLVAMFISEINIKTITNASVVIDRNLNDTEFFCLLILIGRILKITRNCNSLDNLDVQSVDSTIFLIFSSS